MYVFYLFLAIKVFGIKLDFNKFRKLGYPRLRQLVVTMNPFVHQVRTVLQGLAIVVFELRQVI